MIQIIPKGQKDHVNVRVIIDTYADTDNLCVLLVGEDNYVISMLTKNLPESNEIAYDCAFIDIKENPNAMSAIEKHNLGTKTGNHISPDGTYHYPEVRFDLNELRKHCIPFPGTRTKNIMGTAL